jgi:ribosomal-protein-alanine N-acetyltransferase
MRNGPLARGKNIYLRHPRRSDMDEFIGLAHASRFFLRPWVKPAVTAEAYERYLRRSRLLSVCACLVCRNEDQKIIGVCNLTQIFRGDFQNAYLGYWVGAEFSGRGYMKEALRLILRYAFEVLKLHRIEANIQPTNTVSKGLVSRLGFQMEGFSPRYLKISGRWQDHERWAIRSEDWFARQRASVGLD